MGLRTGLKFGRNWFYTKYFRNDGMMAPRPLRLVTREVKAPIVNMDTVTRIRSFSVRKQLSCELQFVTFS